MNRIQRLIQIQPGHTDRFSGLFAGLLVIATIVSAGVAVQIAVPSTTNAARLKSIVTSTAVPQSSEPVVVRPSALMSAPSSTLIPVTAVAILPVPSIGSNALLLPAQDATPRSGAGIASLSSSNPVERAMAACQLGRMGAVEAIPSLINLLADATPIEPINCWASGDWSPARETLIQPTPGEQAAIALASLGQPAVDALIAALGSTNTSTRTNAAWAIGELRGGRGVDREAAVEPLVAALADPNASVRVAAAFSLGEARPRIAVNPLLAALLDADAMVREMAANALGEMKARAAVDGLSALLLRDESERVRRRAAWSLGEIKDAGALDALTAALNDIDHRVRSSVKHAIGEIRD